MVMVIIRMEKLVMCMFHYSNIERSYFSMINIKNSINNSPTHILEYN